MVLVLGQVLKAPGPAGLLGDGDGLDDLAAGQQVDGDGCGALAVLVVVVVPGLGAGDFGGLGVVGVGDDVAGGLIAGDDGLIALDCNLGNGVDDLNTLAELVQLGEGIGPVVVGVQLQGLAGLLAVGQQDNGDVLGTDAVLIVAVGPGLGDGDGGLLGGMLVDDVVAVILGGVSVCALPLYLL